MSEIEKVHVVMVPWLAFGHLIPFLELSIALAKFGIHVSFLSTPRNIQRLPKIPPNLSQFIEFVSIPLPNPDSDPLPEGAESTNDIPAEKMDSLKKACDLLQDPIRNFIAEKSPNWIFVDFFPHWAADIAREFNIHLIAYYINNASTAAFFLTPELLTGDQEESPRDLTKPPHWIDFPSKVAFRNHEVAAMGNAFHVKSTGITDTERIMKLLKSSRAAAIRTCPELEGDYLRVFSKVIGKPVFPVGFLPPQKIPKTVKQEPWNSIFEWLDEQNPRSVVFVVFGSEANISNEQIHEIAYGLELSGLPFLWALRKPKQVDDDDVLPPGFSARTAEQGVVHLGWAPQLEILGHPSVGGLFVHAGWSSIIEAMQFGHVLVFLPLAINQPMIARMMAEEKDLGVEVERAEDGSFTRNDVAGALRKAMFSVQLRARSIQAARDVFGNDDLNCKYVEKFAEYLKNPKSE